MLTNKYHFEHGLDGCSMDIRGIKTPHGMLLIDGAEEEACGQSVPLN